MDEATVVALAATGVTALSVGLNGWSTWWTARNTRAAQREERADQRKAAAYVRVLEHAEGEGRYMAARLHNYELSVDDEHGLAIYRTPEKPEKDERTTCVAQVSAFGSSEVRQAHASWLTAYDDVVESLEGVDWVAREHYGPGHPIADRELNSLRDAVQTEQRQRRELAAAVATDLNHDHE